MATRTAILRGPAMVQVSSQDIYTKGDIEVELDEESFEILTSAYGKVDERIANRIGKVRFEPAGMWTSGLLGVLYPYASTIVGASVFTGTDVPLTIWTLDGRKLIFASSALTKMPDLILSAVKTPFQQCEFTCIGKDNTAWSTANSFLTISSVAFPASTFDPSLIKMGPWTGVWGATAPWDGFQTKDGFNINFNLKLGRLDTDSDGLVDMMFESLEVMAKTQAIVSTGGTPGGITEQNTIDALLFQGGTAKRGQSYQAFTNNADLVMSATGQTVTLKKAAMKGTGFRFGATTVRQGDSAWIGTRPLAAGVVGPLFAIA